MFPFLALTRDSISLIFLSEYCFKVKLLFVGKSVTEIINIAVPFGALIILIESLSYVIFQFEGYEILNLCNFSIVKKPISIVDSVVVAFVWAFSLMSVPIVNDKQMNRISITEIIVITLSMFNTIIKYLQNYHLYRSVNYIN